MKGPIPTRPPSCLVCHDPTTSEGQLCRTCVDNGWHTEDDRIVYTFEVSAPE